MGTLAKECKIITLLPPQATDELTGENVATAANESLSEPAFGTTTKWTAADDFSVASNDAAYAHSAGSGTLTQAGADLATALEGDTYYAFSYDQTAAVTDTSKLDYCRISTGIATSNVSLSDVDDSTGNDYTEVFKTKQNPGDFVIEASTTHIDGNFTLDNFSLQKINYIGDQYINNGILVVHGFGTGAVGSDATINFSNNQSIVLNSADLKADQEVIVKEPMDPHSGYLKITGITNGDANLTLSVMAVYAPKDTTAISGSVETYTDHS